MARDKITPMAERKALIIGAGPAGLTAAFELIKRTDIRPIVLEKSDSMGGISRTVRYKGNRMDIGGHRFFSKSDRVMNWWMDVMPPESSTNGRHNISYRQQSREVAVPAGGSVEAPNPLNEDRVMLIRNRKSRIYFLRQFFDYPIQLSTDTLSKLGLLRTVKIGVSYTKSLVSQQKPEKTLEHFFINRFGKELYLTFFKSYTEKVWGVPCDQISAEWGAQRIKGLSITKAIAHFLKNAFAAKPAGDISQKGTETSLIEKFMYPKLGPGQLWEYVSEDIRAKGGVIKTGWDVDKLHTDGFHITAVEAVNSETGERETIKADYFFSTMPIKELMRCLQAPVPASVLQVSDGLIYRDFITVGVLLKKLKIKENTPHGSRLLKDNWIYIQEPDVMVGRMQIFNNWSPYLVADPENVWLGLEYFCNEADDLWKKSDAEMSDFAKDEMEKIGIIDRADVLDACVIRVPKTYPAYFGTYDRFDEIKSYVSRFDNLFLVGRNGMHKYNNQDHSMLTAMTAVDNIIEGRVDMSNIWALNTEMEYHESKDGK
ncbi:MAG TPA: NAD(P)/FAD-dependent oxidoreductase [Bryobacteraceae bacterium]|jgi:protoporphyrinogen oxidase|nr:NAD(P)/FAD-dependent oxidoreductase [Bryobacteraceae bacterium]